MRRYFLSCLAACVLAVSLSAYPATAADAPKIEVAPPTFDLGTVSDDVKSKAVFTIKNTGTAELVIYDVKTTCGCTVANLSSRKIEPGGTATLEAVYDSHNATGPVHRFINIQSNDTASQHVSVGITANVVARPAPDLTLSAYNATNLQLPKGGKDIRTIRLSSTGQEELVINEFSTTPGLSAEIDKLELGPGKLSKNTVKLKPGETREIKVTTSPKAAGAFQEVLTIRSNSRRKPVVAFIVQGLVQ